MRAGKCGKAIAMKNMTLENIVAACSGTYIGDEGLRSKTVEGVVLDSRKVEEGFLFLATVGERVDGHDFISQVFEKGALCVVCEKRPENPAGPCILVDSSFQALKDIAEFYRRQLPVKVVGITGSVGKTSTKEVIASVLAQKYRVLKTQGNLNNEVGLPLTVLSIREEHEIAVLEMGISDFGEMDRLSFIAKPDLCVITNIGFCHLENLKTQEGILKAKSEIFGHMNPEGVIVVNGDDSHLGMIKDVRGIIPKTFGFEEGNDVYVSEIESLGLSGSRFTIHDGKNAYSAKINLPGRHMALNSAAAALIGRECGLTQEEVVQGICSVKPVSGRSNLVDTGSITIIDDCYNANPVSMKSAIDLLLCADTRKVAVLGDMFELGEDADRMHADTGAYAGKQGVDLLLCAGENAVHMADGAKRYLKGDCVRHYRNTEELEEALLSAIKKGDSVLVKASRGMHFESIVNRLKDHVFEA